MKFLKVQGNSHVLKLMRSVMLLKNMEVWQIFRELARGLSNYSERNDYFEELRSLSKNSEGESIYRNYLIIR